MPVQVCNFHNSCNHQHCIEKSCYIALKTVRSSRGERLWKYGQGSAVLIWSCHDHNHSSVAMINRIQPANQKFTNHHPPQASKPWITRSPHEYFIPALRFQIMLQGSRSHSTRRNADPYGPFMDSVMGPSASFHAWLCFSLFSHPVWLQCCIGC